MDLWHDETRQTRPPRLASPTVKQARVLMLILALDTATTARAGQ
jgi:hypothetical protein